MSHRATLLAVWALTLTVAGPVASASALELTDAATTPDALGPSPGSMSKSTRSAYGPWDKSLDQECLRQKRAYEMQRVMAKREARLYGRPPKALPPFECQDPSRQP